MTDGGCIRQLLSAAPGQDCGGTCGLSRSCVGLTWSCSVLRVAATELLSAVTELYQAVTELIARQIPAGSCPYMRRSPAAGGI